MPMGRRLQKDKKVVLKELHMALQKARYDHRGQVYQHGQVMIDTCNLQLHEWCDFG